MKSGSLPKKSRKKKQNFVIIMLPMKWNKEDCGSKYTALSNHKNIAQG